MAAACAEIQSSIQVGESTLFGQMIAYLKKGEILLADRGFCSFHAFGKMSQVGVDALMRLNDVRRVDFRKGKRLSLNDQLLTWKKPVKHPKGCTQQEFVALPTTMILRHVRLTASARGYRTQTVTLVTTLLGPVVYPLQPLGELYL